MKPSNDLYNLIKSLNQSEKRHFKVFASRHVIGKKNNYVKLFDAIEKQTEYDEEVIRKKFAGTKFINQFSVAKNYLYNILLKSLHTYYSNHSAASKVDELLHEAYILHKKALYSQERKLLEKALDIAVSYELFPRTLEILRLKMNLKGKIPYTRDYKKELERMNKMQQNSIIKIENLWEYLNLKAKHTVITKRLVTRTREDINEMNNILSDKLLSDEKKAITFDSKNIFLNLKAVVTNKKGQWKRTYEIIKKQIALLESRPELLPENMERYINASANYLLITKTAGTSDEFEMALRKFKSIFDKYHRYIDESSRLLMMRALNSELSMYIDAAEFEKGFESTKEFESRISAKERKANKYETTISYFHIGQLLFIISDYDKSVYWLNKIINDRSPEISRDVNCYTRILNLIVHFEMNDFFLLEYTLRSTYRYLSKIQRLYKFEIVILEFLGKTFRIKTYAEFLDLLAMLRERLVKLSRDTYEKKPIKDLFLIEWIDSKIQKRRLDEILRQKAMQNRE